MTKRNGLKWQLPFLLLLIIGTVWILRKQAPYQTDQGLVFGTMYKITYQSEENLKADIEAELQKVDCSLSPFNKQSVITHINNNTDMRTDSLFDYVFNLARKVSEETHGAFDITVAPLVNAWGFGFKNAARIDSATIDSLRQFVGFEKIRLEDGKIIKNDPRTMLDCSAIAKGFGVDCVARLLDRKGVRNYMIDIGGELVMKGENAQMATWRIGINKPIDGYPIQHNILSATVVADDCATADAYATAFMVLGLDSAKAICDAHPELDAYFIYTQEDGKMDVYYTEGMEKYIVR